MSQFTVVFFLFFFLILFLYHSAALSLFLSTIFFSRLISVAEHDNRIIKIHNFSEALDNDDDGNSSNSSNTNEVGLCERPEKKRVLKILIYWVYVCVLLCVPNERVWILKMKILLIIYYFILRCEILIKVTHTNAHFFHKKPLCCS